MNVKYEMEVMSLYVCSNRKELVIASPLELLESFVKTLHKHSTVWMYLPKSEFVLDIYGPFNETLAYLKMKLTLTLQS